MDTLPIKAVLFDLDDTLWPIMPVIQNAELVLWDWLRANAPATVSRFTIDSLRARRMALLPTNPRYQFDVWSLRHTILREAFTECGDDPALADAAMKVFSQARNQVTPFDDVLPSLQRLRSKFTLGTISNGFADLDAIGLAPHFTISIAAHSIGIGKPDPAIFLHACEQLGMEPAHTVYAGDDLHLDIEGAQKAGLRAVWINRFERTAPPHIAPDAVCTSLTILEDWLDQHAIARR
jgi:putative hydrolase of the HAD superfamily